MGPSRWASASEARGQRRLRHRGSDPSLPSARPKISAASIDAFMSPVRAQRPFEPFVAILWIHHAGRDSHKRRKGFNPRLGPCVASIDAAKLHHGSRRGGGSSQCALHRAVVGARSPQGLGANPSLPSARPETSAASIDAFISPVRAQRPFEPFVAILRADRPERVGHKRRKGSNPRSEPCVASIDAAKLNHGSR